MFSSLKEAALTVLFPGEAMPRLKHKRTREAFMVIWSEISFAADDCCWGGHIFLFIELAEN